MPLQGDRFAAVITQGDALGYELLPLQGVRGKTCKIESFYHVCASGVLLSV